MNKEIKMIQKALKDEGRMENGQLVVPNDFFNRLNAALNSTPRRSVIDMILDAADKQEDV